MTKFEVDGWKGYDRDAENQHNHVSSDENGHKASVSFVRYVSDKPGKEQ